MKICKTCNEKKRKKDFYFYKTGYYSSECKECHTKRTSINKKNNWRNPEKDNECAKRWQKENREKYRVHLLTRKAKRDGSLKEKPCENCGSNKAEMHHDDYTKPLKIRWLCRRHHRKIHRMI